MAYIQPYLDYFSQNPGWAIAIVFLIAFGEALLIIGLFVPSTAVLVGAGMLVGTGHLEFWPVFLATAAGAIVGDQISYWAGRLFGDRLKTLWPLNRYPQLVARGEDFVRGHGGKSIAIGRFVPGVKAVIPGIVGMFGMSQVYFAAVNFSSGLVWAAAHIFPGMLLGTGLALAGELSGRLLFVLMMLLVILAIAGYLIRLAAAGLSPFLGHLLGNISNWAKSKQSRSMRRFGRAVAPENPRSLLIVLFAAVFITGLIGLVDMATGLMARDAFSNADVSVFNLMKEMRNAPADEIMITITMLGDGAVLTVMAVIIVVWLAWRRAYRGAIAAAIAIIAGKVFVPVLKYGIQRPRPTELYSGAEIFSFPSGHATMAMLIFGILAVLVSHSMGRWGRAVVYATCGIAVIAIAYSRVYLGAHWLSDVAGGLLFGAVMTAAFAVAIEAIPPRRIMPLGLFGAALLAFVVAGAMHVSADYGAAEAAYAPPELTRRIDVTQWQDGGWRRLPLRRIDLAGKTEEVFLAQWAGGLEPLRDALAASDWTETPKWTWRDAIPYLNPNAALSEVLPRPALHEGLKAKLTMVRVDSGNGERRQVIRVYKTDLEISAGQGVYLVSLTDEELRKRFHLYAVPAPLPAAGDEAAALLQSLVASPKFTVIAKNAVKESTPALILARP
jgi:membrane protein DedA with SNARE-associated domain/membrane-associated phospholipid phosphatase